MKFIEPHPYADPDAAARKIIEIANSIEAVQDGRIHVEKINAPFLYQLKGSPAEYVAGIKRTIENGSSRTKAYLRRPLPTYLPDRND